MARIGSLAQELPYVLGGSEKEQKTKNNRHPKSDCTYGLPSDRCPPKHFMDPMLTQLILSTALGEGC